MSGIRFYSCNEYRLEAHGLEELDAPLTIVATCQLCGSKLTSRSYSKQEYAAFQLQDFIEKINNQAKADALRALRHECRLN